MTTGAVHQLTPADARRMCVHAQLLSARRPTDLLGLVRHLTLLQVEPTKAVAPSADVVAWSRLGNAYDPRELEEALAAGTLVELGSMLRPAEDIALYRAEMAAWPGPGALSEWQRDVRAWVEANDHCRRDILERLYDEGPLPASAFPDTTAVPWQSSGWNNDRNIRMLVEKMVARGEIASAGREGRERLWDLAERVYPDVEPVPLEEAFRIRAERRLRSLGLARARATAMPGEPNDVGEAGEPAVVEGVRGKWRVHPAYLDSTDLDLGAGGRVALLSPLDRLVFDRKRMADLLGFDYQLEMYKPAAKRRWGYWALPVLAGDLLVGKVDATADRESGVLRVDAVHEDPLSDGGGWPDDLRAAVEAEVDALCLWLGLEEVVRPD